ncbi:MAG: ERF family protein, partial [Planctomycetaceae bacterium]
MHAVETTQPSFLESKTEQTAPAAFAGPRIWGAIADAKREVQAVGKGLETSSGARFSYRGFDAVVNAVAPVLDKWDIVVVPLVVSKDTWTQQTSGGKSLRYTELEVQFTFGTRDGSVINCSTIGQAMDSGDKSATKAHTVAYRIALCQVFNLAYEDMTDPEAGPQDGWVDNAKTMVRLIKDLTTCKDTRQLNAVVGAAINCLKGQHPTDSLTDKEFESLLPSFEDAGKTCGADMARLRNHLDLAMGKVPADVPADQEPEDKEPEEKKSGNGFQEEPVRFAELDLRLKNAGNQEAREAAIVLVFNSLSAGDLTDEQFNELLSTHFSSISGDDAAGYFVGALVNVDGQAALTSTVTSLTDAKSQGRIGEGVALAL